MMFDKNFDGQLLVNLVVWPVDPINYCWIGRLTF